MHHHYGGCVCVCVYDDSVAALHPSLHSCMVCLRRTSLPLLVPLLGRALCSSLTESCPGAVSLPLIEEAPPGKRRPSYSVASSSSPSLFAHYALVGERPGCIQLMCNKTQLARRQRRHNQGEAQEGVITPQQTPNRAWGRGGTSRQTKRECDRRSK